MTYIGQTGHMHTPGLQEHLRALMNVEPQPLAYDIAWDDEEVLDSKPHVDQ